MNSVIIFNQKFALLGATHNNKSSTKNCSCKSRKRQTQNRCSYKTPVNLRFKSGWFSNEYIVYRPTYKQALPQQQTNIRNKYKNNTKSIMWLAKFSKFDVIWLFSCRLHELWWSSRELRVNIKLICMDST